MTMETQRPATRPWLLLALLLTSLLVAVGYIPFRPAMPRALVRQIQTGMTQAEVEHILGSPRDVRNDDWYYSRLGNQGWLAVSFDHQGRVVNVNDESVFP